MTATLKLSGKMKTVGFNEEPAPFDDTVHTFNTGRKYTIDGQRIAWTVVEFETDDVFDWCVTVAFADVDRGIDGTVKCFVDDGDDVTDRQVLNGYDRGGYGWIEDADLRKSLHEAASRIS